MKFRSDHLAPALAVIAGLLLTACPMTSGKPPATPENPSSDDKNCLQPALPEEPLPDLEPWTGEVPPTAPGTIWVIAPLDEQGDDHLLTLVQPEKGAVVKTIGLKAKDLTAATQKMAEARLPLIAFAGLGSLRPVPQPGPPGEPKLWAIRFSLNAARGMFWAMRDVQLSSQAAPPPRVPVTHR
jgi:hypothetical protein